MYLSQFFFSILLSLLLFSCSENNDVACFSFDQRSCQEDPWSQIESDLSLEELVSSYLSAERISIEKIEIDLNFHQVVCLACGVCPDGPRIFVTIPTDQTDRLSGLNLLNFETEACTSN